MKSDPPETGLGAARYARYCKCQDDGSTSTTVELPCSPTVVTIVPAMTRLILIALLPCSRRFERCRSLTKKYQSTTVPVKKSHTTGNVMLFCIASSNCPHDSTELSIDVGLRWVSRPPRSNCVTVRFTVASVPRTTVGQGAHFVPAPACE